MLLVNDLMFQGLWPRARHEVGVALLEGDAQPPH